MHYECFNAHANGAMQWMTSLLPTNHKEGSEGYNHIAISQRALLYRYLLDQFGYGFFKCISTRRVQMHILQCMHFMYFIIQQQSTRYNIIYFKVEQLKQITSNFRLYCQCEILKIQWRQFKQQSQSVWTTVPRLLAFTEDRERELSMIQRCITCSQICLSTKTITLQIKYIEKSIHTSKPNVLTQNTLIQT